MYTLTTGVHHHSRQRNNVSAAQCRIGVGSFDVETQAQLKEWYGWATGNLLEAEIIRATTTNSTVTNRTVFYAGNATSLDELTSAHVLNLEDITRLENALNENMAQPFSLTTDGVSDISEYLIMAPHYGWDALRATDEWKNLLKLAGERGGKNQLFGGGMPKWGGSKLFDWRIQVPDSYGPAGCFAAPFAFLGEAISAGSTAFTVKGGGSAAAAALTDRAYFIHFPNSQFKMFEQEKLTRDTTTVRYVIAKHATQKKWAFASYKVTAAGDLDDATGTIAPANTLTIFKMLSATNAGDALNTIGDVTWNSGVWANIHCEWSDLPVGSKLYPCNSKGQPYVQVVWPRPARHDRRPRPRDRRRQRWHGPAHRKLGHRHGPPQADRHGDELRRQRRDRHQRHPAWHGPHVCGLQPARPCPRSSKGASSPLIPVANAVRHVTVPDRFLLDL
jgi:hypothetical protein